MFFSIFFILMFLNKVSNLIIYSPLEQFEIYTFVNTPMINQVYNFHVSYADQLSSIFQQFFYGAFTGSNAFFTVLNLIFLFICFNHTLWFNEKLIAFSWQKGLQTYFTIIVKMIEELVVHPLSKQYFYIFFTFIFFLINIVNLFGLIPYTFVLTSQFFFTFGLAFIFFISLNLTGLVLHGYTFLTLFYPSGTPIFIVPLLVLIEFISYIARVFSLAIRLFANITAGHILVKILSWLTWMILDIFVISGLSFIIISALWVLEFFISVLQAYVFLTLLCLYLNDVLQLH